MYQQLPALPDFPQHVFSVPWGDRQITVTLTWFPRLRGWYFDLQDADGNVIVRGRRVSPGSAPLRGLALADKVGRAVALLVDGPEPYVRGDLGSAVRMLLLDLEKFESPPKVDPNASIRIPALEP